MVTTLFCAKDQLEDEIIISYGDIVYSKDILLSFGVQWRDWCCQRFKLEDYWEARSSDPLSDAKALRLIVLEI